MGSLVVTTCLSNDPFIPASMPDSFHDVVGGEQDDGRLAADIEAAQRDLAKVDGENHRLTRLYVTETISEAEYLHQRKGWRPPSNAYMTCGRNRRRTTNGPPSQIRLWHGPRGSANGWTTSTRRAAGRSCGWYWKGLESTRTATCEWR